MAFLYQYSSTRVLVHVGTRTYLLEYVVTTWKDQLCELHRLPSSTNPSLEYGLPFLILMPTVAMLKSHTSETHAKYTTEKSLEAAVFGDEDFFDRFAEKPGSQHTQSDSDFETERANGIDLAKLEDDQLFMIDDGQSDGHDSAAQLDDNEIQKTEEQHDKRASVWQDSDDENISISLASVARLRKLRRVEGDDIVTGPEYSRLLQAQFERIYPVPDWALPASHRRKRRRSNEESSDDDENMRSSEVLGSDPLKALFRSSERYTKASKTRILKPGKLDIRRLRDANHQSPSHSALQTLSFHPYLPLMLTGGYDRTLRLFHIDGKLNAPAASLHLRTVPIEVAEFHPDGKRVFIGGKRRYFHIWNLESGTVQKITGLHGFEGMQASVERFALSKSGKYVALVVSGGWTNILSADTGQWLDGFKVTRGVSDLVWHKDDHLTVANLGSELWQYNVQERRIVLRWNDTGGMDTTKIVLGGHRDQYLAVGSKSGLVNIYDRSHDGLSAPTFVKTLSQLTTSIHDLTFSPDGQILAMASRAKKDALRMVHLPTATIFQNWPTQNTPLGKVGCFAFSTGSEFAIGNEAGRVTLWAL